MDRHPKPVLLNDADLVVDFPNDRLKLVELLRRNYREVVHHNDGAETVIVIVGVLLRQIRLVVTAQNRRTTRANRYD